MRKFANEMISEQLYQNTNTNTNYVIYWKRFKLIWIHVNVDLLPRVILSRARAMGVCVCVYDMG